MNTQPSVSEIDCDALRELIPDYAFGLTSPDETRMIESGLARCPEAASQLADFRQIKTVLHTSVPQIDPPPQLRDRLMAAAAADVRASRPRRRIHPAWFAAAATLVLMLITNVFWVARVNSISVTPTFPPEAPEAVNVQGDAAFVVNPANDLRWVWLPAADQNGDASAVLMWNSQSAIGLLYAEGLAKSAVGKTYHLWLTKGATHVSAGTFQVDNNGKATLLFHLSQPIDQYTWARITAEPSNNSDAFSGTVLVNGKLS